MIETIIYNNISFVICFVVFANVFKCKDFNFYTFQYIYIYIRNNVYGLKFDVLTYLILYSNKKYCIL